MSGQFGWVDLTVSDAEGVRDFYAQVAGWRFAPVDMGDYSDFVMLQSDRDEPVAGVCHARGQNADLPAAWLVYITIEDLDAAVAQARSLGGTVISESPAGIGKKNELAAPITWMCAKHDELAPHQSRQRVCHRRFWHLKRTGQSQR